MVLGNDQRYPIQVTGVEAKGKWNSRLNWKWVIEWFPSEVQNVCPMQLASFPVVGRPLLGFSNHWQQLIRKGRSRKTKQKPRQASSLRWFFWVSSSPSWPWPSPWFNGFLDILCVTMDHLKWQDLWILRLWSWDLALILGCRSSSTKVVGAKRWKRDPLHPISLPTSSHQLKEQEWFRYILKTRNLTQNFRWVLKSRPLNQNVHRSCIILTTSTTQWRHVAFEFIS